jgi:hypothetical protein
MRRIGSTLDIGVMTCTCSACELLQVACTSSTSRPMLKLLSSNLICFRTKTKYLTRLKDTYIGLTS